MVEKRKSLHIDTIKRIGKKKNNFLTTQIPYRSDIEKMGIEKRPVPEYAENSPATEAYFSLWEEINSL
jgi:cellulose biosynthesis protein BcsQ